VSDLALITLTLPLKLLVLLRRSEVYLFTTFSGFVQIVNSTSSESVREKARQWRKQRQRHERRRRRNDACRRRSRHRFAVRVAVVVVHSQDIHRQADSIPASQAAARLHQPEKRRQPGRQAAAQVLLVTQPSSGLRLVTGRTANGVSRCKHIVAFRMLVGITVQQDSADTVAMAMNVFNGKRHFSESCGPEILIPIFKKLALLINQRLDLACKFQDQSVKGGVAMHASSCRRPTSIFRRHYWAKTRHKRSNHRSTDHPRESDVATARTSFLMENAIFRSPVAPKPLLRPVATDAIIYSCFMGYYW